MNNNTDQQVPSTTEEIIDNLTVITSTEEGWQTISIFKLGGGKEKPGPENILVTFGIHNVPYPQGKESIKDLRARTDEATEIDERRIYSKSNNPELIWEALKVAAKIVANRFIKTRIIITIDLEALGDNEKNRFTENLREYGVSGTVDDEAIMREINRINTETENRKPESKAFKHRLNLS